ncbi:MAG: hypothetical protein DRP56_04125 [Planctomycetota bacterium]|nr:MAG: hypothetical protein DRP56_04125 [Planctomycetota bacterium]
MSDDHILLSDILDDHGLGVKWLKAAVGRSIAQVYRYLSGEATIPSVVWRVLYDKTRDVRITEIVTGEVPVVIVDLLGDFGRGARISRVPEIANLIKMRSRQIEAEQQMLDILSDGKIDAQDAGSMRELEKDFKRMLKTQSQIYYAIKQQYERSQR